jgi:hypothetical protein
MKGKLNPELKVGDRIMCLHMEGETGVPPGTLGTVKKISRDPFESPDENIINVNWDNGSTLALISSTDAWKFAPEESIQESTNSNSEWDFIVKNEDVLENFDWRWLREFLYKIRKSGIINMFGASPLLYAGKQHIDRYYGEGREDDEDFQAVLDDADEARNKIVQGVMKYMEKNNKDLDNLNQINAFARNFAQKIIGLYIIFSKYRKEP